MFIGEYLHNLDDKKRLSIPLKFRTKIGKKAVITRGLDGCLVLYPAVEWQKLAEKLGSLPTSQLDARGFARLMLSGAMEVDFDSLGRILIPDYLKDYAELKKSAKVVGLFNRIEVWDEEKWEKYRKKIEASAGDIAENLKELGI